MSKTIPGKSNHNRQNKGLFLPRRIKLAHSAIEKFKKDKNYYKKTVGESEIKEHRKIDLIIRELGGRMNISNDCILEYPSEILNAIVFDSGIKPWWLLVNSLSKYVEWIYIHSIDVAAISLMIAWEMEYTGEELWNLGLGAFLHDVGKLLIPQSIIQKPGPLNDMEVTFMRQHCEVGMDSIEVFNLPEECTDIILQHHERLDGTGYPKGLKENEISHNAKIVMIADVIDAIISYRPYRPIRGIDAALKILKNEEKKYSQEILSILEKILKNAPNSRRG